MVRVWKSGNQLEKHILIWTVEGDAVTTDPRRSEAHVTAVLEAVAVAREVWESGAAPAGVFGWGRGSARS